MQVLIRPFRPADLDGLFVLDYRCYAPPYRFGYQQLLGTLQQREITALVIEGERPGDIVGGLIVRSERPANRLAVVSLMIEPDVRRLGLGTRLLRWAAEFAARSGWEAVVVPVERDNEAAAAFLRANGAEDSGTAQPYFPDPQTGTLWRLPAAEAATQADEQEAAPADDAAPGDGSAADTAAEGRSKAAPAEEGPQEDAEGDAEDEAAHPADAESRTP